MFMRPVALPADVGVARHDVPLKCLHQVAVVPCALEPLQLHFPRTLPLLGRLGTRKCIHIKIYYTLESTLPVCLSVFNLVSFSIVLLFYFAYLAFLLFIPNLLFLGFSHFNTSTLF